MPKLATHVLDWSASQQAYELRLNNTKGASPTNHVLPIQLDSPAWFAWLEQTTSFSYQGRSCACTVRKETKQYGDAYWYAYLHSSGKLTKKYLGKTQGLTITRLEQIADALHDGHLACIKDKVAKKTQGRMISATPAASERDLLWASRLHMPRLRTKLVARPQLEIRFQESRTRMLTLIVAPAGFGKTTALSAWLQNTTSNTAWVSLEHSDNDLQCFWAYIFTALNNLQPGLYQNVLKQIQNPQAEPLEQLLTAGINRLSELAHEAVLVLDDYHEISEESIHTSLNFLLQHLHPQLRLVIITRSEPPLQLARLRAQDQICEIRTSHLRFSCEEAASFLNQIMGLSLIPQDVARLEELTEGWIVGLQLAALSMQRQTDIPGRLAALSDKRDYIFNYLAEEVLQRQPAHIQQFLLHTAPLHRLQHALCQEVTGSNNSQANLEYLERTNLFIVALDEEHNWYRYHQLFAEFLRDRLLQSQPEQIPELHRRAAHWYQHNNAISEALQHLLAAGDSAPAGRLIKEQSQQMMSNGALSQLRAWFKLLPDSYIRSQPSLNITYAITLVCLGQVTLANERLQETEMAIEALKDKEQVEIAALESEIVATRAMIASFRLQTQQAIECAQQALERLPAEQVYIRSITTLSLGIAYRFKNGQAARQVLGAVCEQAKSPHIAAMSSAHLAFQLQEEGHLNKASEMYLRALQLIQSEQPIPASSIAYLGLGELQREWNDLPAANRYLAEALRLGQQWEFVSVLTGITAVNASVKIAQGEYEHAFILLRHSEQQALQAQDYASVDILRAYRAWGECSRGNVQLALQWMQAFEENNNKPLSTLCEREYIILVRILLANEQYERATNYLVRILQQAQDEKRMRTVIKLKVLQALAYQGQGRLNEAYTTIVEALLAAEPEGYVRTFVEEREPLAHLLATVIANDPPATTPKLLLKYARRLLKTTEQEIYATMQRRTLLSERELAILRLIAAGMPNQEIACACIIALSTVKWHIKQIYNKLNVNSRTQVLAKAKELSLL